MQADLSAGGNKSTGIVALITVMVLIGMLLAIYRSLVTVTVVLVTVLLEAAAARGAVALLGNAHIIELSTFATNILTFLAVAAGTDYAIFVLGRYHEARRAGAEPDTAFFAMYRGTAHVILGSGVTVAGAVLCLTFTRLPSFQTMGVPAAIGVVTMLAASLTLMPAVLVVCSRFGLLEPKRAARNRAWRRIGTVNVRWPGPVLVATLAIAAVGLLGLPAMQTTYDARPYISAEAPANIGYAAAERHFSQGRLNPELLMIESDRDMRNPADMLILERVAKGVLHTPGIALVQSITRPLGTPLKHSSIPFLISSPSAGTAMNLSYQQDRAADLLVQANGIRDTIGILNQQLELQNASAAATVEQTQAFHDTVDLVRRLSDPDREFR